MIWRGREASELEEAAHILLKKDEKCPFFLSLIKSLMSVRLAVAIAVS